MSEQPYYRQTAEEVLAARNASAGGLTDQEARRRLEQFGPNKLSEGKKKSTLQVFLEQFKDLLDTGAITQEEYEAKKKELLGL